MLVKGALDIILASAVPQIAIDIDILFYSWCKELTE